MISPSFDRSVFIGIVNNLPAEHTYSNKRIALILKQIRIKNDFEQQYLTE
jgi:hypothetical protein